MIRIALVKIAANGTDFEVDFLAGQRVVRGTVVEMHEDRIRGINIRGDEVSRMLALCGLMKKFSQDYWSFRDGNIRPLPWDYGQFPDDVVPRERDVPHS